VADLDSESRARRSGRPGAPVDPHRLRRALWRGRFLLIGATVFGVSFGVFWAKVVMGRSYKTTALLKYEGDVDVPGIESSSSVYSLGPAAEALERRSFLSKLAEEVGFEGRLSRLGRMIQYKPDFLTSTLHISVSGRTAEESAERTHLVTKLFLQHHSERQARRIEQEIARVTKRIEGAKNEAEDARRRYNEFREKHGIADLSTEQRSLVNSAVGLRADSEFAASDIRALEARVGSLEAQLSTIPKTSVVSSSTSPERAAYNRLRQELASARASLSDDHPRVQALQQQVNELQSQIRSGGSGGGLVGNNATYLAVSKELRAAKAQLTVLKERQKGLSEMAEKAQARVESLSGIEGEASELLAEMQVNDALVVRLHATEAALEDTLEHLSSGFTVLDPGAPPEYAERNKRKPIVFAAISMLSFLLALSFVLWPEFRGLRVRTPEEVAFWGSGPVLGATPWPVDAHGLDELVAGLDDFAPEAKGSLLIIGGLPEDSALAQTLARRMNDDWFLDRPDEQTMHTSVPPEPAPLRTPPPSGPYPIGGSRKQSAVQAQPSTALALQPVKLVRREDHLRLDAWDGPFEGQALRRAARLADRIIVLVRSGAMTCFGLNAIKRRIGREDGIGYVVLGLPEDFQTLPDRAGNVAEFWES
jgi:succinoglycan biosynthesis transport protein ExoP